MQSSFVLIRFSFIYMSPFYRLSGLLAFLSSTVLAPVLAQPLPQYSTEQRARQQAVQQTLSQQQAANYQKALAVMKRQGRAEIEPAGSGQIRVLRGLDEETGNLLYDISHTNVRAANTTRTSSLWGGGSLGVDLNGSSPTVRTRLGMWEIGGTYVAHPEFQNRVIQQDNATATNRSGGDINHATHVAGTMVAAGLNTNVRGMANGASLRAWDANSDVSEMTAAGPDLLVSNHSYGSITGWRFNSSRTTTNKWEWWGDTTVSATQDYRFGFYDNTARNWDIVANAAPNYLIVKTAGNNHAEGGPPAGESYFLVNNGSRQSTTPRDPQNGYDNIATYGNAKNTLTVGAVSAIRDGYNRPQDVVLAGFSSWGPTDDGRIKPDIVGVGVSVTSSQSIEGTPYGALSGTSMAAPNVSGSLLLLQEYYGSLNNNRLMRASTLKALVLHTAEEAGPAPGPDYRHGWGLLNTDRAAQVIRNAERTHILSELTLAQAATYSLSVVASGRGPLVATIAWNDPAGTVATGAARSNDRTAKLVNDLDIRLTDGTTNTLPWTLDPENPDSPAVPGDNIRDNVEQVFIANPVPGRTYVLTVGHKGPLRNSTQDYALVVSGAGGTAYAASAAASPADTKITRVQLGSVDQPGTAGCTTYTDFMSLTNVTTVQPNQPLTITVVTGTCGAPQSAIVRLFADWNANGTFTDAGELLGTSGVLTGSGTFVGSITAPASVAPGTVVRLRIVAQQTTDPAAVQPAGTYPNGETQEYLLRVIPSQNNVAATELISPTATLCAGSPLVSLRVRNVGGADQQNLPVSVQISTGAGTPVASLSTTVALLRAYRDAVVTFELPASASLVAGQTYRFTSRIRLSTDQDTANNTLIINRAVGVSSAVGNFSASACGTDPSIRLNNSGPGIATWYDALTGGTLLAVGNNTAAPTRAVYYASLNEFGGRLGPASKTEFPSGSYFGNFGPQPLISTRVPLRIERARIYTGAPGRLTFSIRRFDETVVSSVTLDVIQTRTLPASATIAGGQQANDPNDPGALYTLNLSIPEPGNYKIGIEYEDGVTIFRSNTATAAESALYTFPYQLRSVSGDVIASSRGSLFNTSDTLRTAWYYLYDMQLRPLDCPTATRTAVTPQIRPSATATLSVAGATSACVGSAVVLTGAATTAVAGEVIAFRWLRDGQLISGATSRTYAATSAGNYAVQVTGNCAPVSSSAIAVNIVQPQVPVIVQSGITLSSNAPLNQWLRSGIPIPGATGQNFTVTQTGRYSVQANVNGCGEALSQEVLVEILATEPLLSANVRAYPNPTTNRLTVEVDAPATPLPAGYVPTVRLFDARGTLQQQQTMFRALNKYTTTLDLSNLPSGTLFVQIQADPAQPPAVRPVLKE
jgi:hypothetical protein